MVQAKKLEERTGMGFSEIESMALDLYALHLKRNRYVAVPDYTESQMKAYEKELGGFRIKMNPEEADELKEQEDDLPLF